MKHIWTSALTGSLDRRSILPFKIFFAIKRKGSWFKVPLLCFRFKSGREIYSMADISSVQASDGYEIVNRAGRLKTHGTRY